MIDFHSRWMRRAPAVAPVLSFAAVLLLSGAAFVAIALMPEAKPATPLAAQSASAAQPDNPPGPHAFAGAAGCPDVR